MLGLPKILFRTAILSVVLGIAVTCIWYAIIRNPDSGGYAHKLPTIIIGALYFNMILALMSLPMLFFASPAIRKNTLIKLMLYFAGPCVVILTIVISKNDDTNRTFYLLLAGIYTLVHAFYYFRVVNKLT